MAIMKTERERGRERERESERLTAAKIRVVKVIAAAMLVAAVLDGRTD